MVRILQVVGKMHRAGMETLIMNIYRNIDRKKVQFDFCVHTTEKGAYDDEILSLGGKIFHMPEAKIKNIFALKREVKSFFRLHSDYTAVHVHYSCVGWLFFMEADKNNIKNLIYHAHSSGREKGIKALIRFFLEQYSAKLANTYFACSDKAAKYFFHNRKYIMLNNGIDTVEFSFKQKERDLLREQYKIKDYKVFIHVGRFSIEKNHVFLLDLFNKIHTENPNTILLLLGNGPLESEIKEKASMLECADSIKFMGNRNDVGKIMNIADIFLLPSLFEGLPLTMIEAQCSGLTCFVSDNITRDAEIIKELVFYCSLKDDDFYKKIKENMNIERKDRVAEIKAHGFDSYGIAKKMEKYYLNLGAK